MYEELQFAADGGADPADVLQRDLPFQHQPAETEPFVEGRFFGGADGTLRGGVQRQDVRPCQGEVLHDDGIDTGVLRRPEQPLRLGKFTVVQDGVEGKEDPCSEAPGVGAQTGDVVHRVACRLPCAEGGAGDIDGIGTAVDGCDADIRIPCRSKKFEVSHYLPRAAIICLAWAPNFGSSATFL